MPYGLSLLQYLKKTPNSNTRNQILPNQDVRYLEMKLRAGQTEDLFRIIDASDEVQTYIDKEGRFVGLGRTNQASIVKGWTFYFLKTILTQDDLRDAIQFADADGANRVELVLPAGQVTCNAPIIQTADGFPLTVIRGGYNATSIYYNPSAPSSVPVIEQNAAGVELIDLGFQLPNAGLNLSNSPVVDIGNNGKVDNCYFVNGAPFASSVSCIKLSGPGASVKDTYINNRYHGIEVAISGGDDFSIMNCKIVGITSSGSRGISYSGSVGLIIGNRIENFDYAIYGSSNPTLVGLAVNSNYLDGNTSDIFWPTLTPANGNNTFVGNILVNGTTNGITTGACITRGNIGLADQN